MQLEKILKFLLLIFLGGVPKDSPYGLASSLKEEAGEVFTTPTILPQEILSPEEIEARGLLFIYFALDVKDFPPFVKERKETEAAIFWWINIFERRHHESFLFYVQGVMEVMKERIISVMFKESPQAFKDKEGRAWWQKRAEEGYKQAECLVGYLRFYWGKDFIPCLSYNNKAKQWFSKAAEQGYAPAQCELSADWSWRDMQFLTLCAQAAEQGYAPAQYILGKRAHERKASEESQTWYLKAAEQRYPLAQHKAGKIFQTINYEMSASYFNQAAQQGYAPAQYQIGLIEERDNSLDKAVVWYLKSAQQNYEKAYKRLKTQIFPKLLF